MSNALEMGGLQRISHLSADLDKKRRRHGPIGNLVGECLSIDILHRDEGNGITLSNVINRRNIRMVQSGCCFGLTHEAPHPFLVQPEFRRQYLESLSLIHISEP